MAKQDIAVDPQQLEDQQHLGRLLLRAYRAFSTRAVEKLRQRGYEGLALAQMTLLMNIGVEGIRLTTLAERIGVSRQAVGNLVDNLESREYVSRKADLTDKRAMIVTLTDEGWRLIGDVVAVKKEIETEYGEILGEDKVEMLRSELTRLLERVEPTNSGQH
ncbi:MarR family transcriptional regulator [bacterium]|nr:MarR family transcriptional regulator [bacterium]